METRKTRIEKNRPGGVRVDLSRVLDARRVVVLDSGTKGKVLETLIGTLAETSEVRNRAELKQAIADREKIMSTGIGLGVAVPHARVASISRMVMAACLCREGVAEYASLDDEPVRLVFMIAAGRDQHTEYLRLLAEIQHRVKNKVLRQKLLDSSTSLELYETLVGRNS